MTSFSSKMPHSVLYGGLPILKAAHLNLSIYQALHTHSNFELWLAKSDGSPLFKKDATFIISPPLTVHPPPVRID